MNWDDLRILAAVRDSGTYMGAGKSLRLDETTIARRVARLQQTLGLRLFDPVDGARVPTDSCRSALSHIDAMAIHAVAIGHLKSAGPNQGLVAKYRIATPNALTEEVLAPHLSALLLQQPRLTVQLLTSNVNVNFSRWEADFALRLKKPQRGDFTISRIANIPLYLFEPVEPLPGGHEPTVCAYPADLDDTPESRFLEKRGIKSGARCITPNASVIREMIKSRSAIGILPAYLCNDLLSDRALRATQIPHSREVWLLTQDHLKRDAGARTTIAWIRGCFDRLGRK